MICFVPHNHPALVTLSGPAQGNQLPEHPYMAGLMLGGLLMHPCLAAMIGCMAACGEPEDDFWLLYDDETERMRAVLCRTGDCLYVTGDHDHWEEISAFIDLMSFGCVESDLPLQPQGMTRSTNAVLRWWGTPGRAILREGVLLSTREQEEVPLAQLAELLCRVKLLPDDALRELSVVLLHRIRAGRAAALMLRKGSSVQSVAAITHISCGIAMLGGVATAPEFRGEGLGTRIVTVAAALAREWGLTPMLACSEGRVSFYTQAGFIPSLPFYRYERKTTL